MTVTDIPRGRDRATVAPARREALADDPSLPPTSLRLMATAAQLGLVPPLARLASEARAASSGPGA